MNSSLDRDERNRRYRQIAAGQYSLLYVTPERFRKEEFLAVLRAREINLLAVDEAHCISEWGHDFRPDYTRVGEFRRELGNPTTIALTATATPDVQTDILRQLGLAAFGEATELCQLFHEGIQRPNLSLQVREVWGLDEKVGIVEEDLETMGQCERHRLLYFDSNAGRDERTTLQAGDRARLLSRRSREKRSAPSSRWFYARSQPTRSSDQCLWHGN